MSGTKPAGMSGAGSGWTTGSPRAGAPPATAHFSWHAALHELALGDTKAVRRRYYSQLAPPLVTGGRALVDSASLLWRWRIATSEWDDAAASGLSAPPAFDGDGPPPPVEPVLDVVEDALLVRPETPFTALHAALARATSGDVRRLDLLHRHCEASGDVTLKTVAGAVCDALVAVVHGRWRDAVVLLSDVLPVLVRVGGSAAQREVIEETLLFCLVNDGQAERAARLLDARLDRRPSPLDQRRLQAMAAGRDAAGAAR